MASKKKLQASKQADGSQNTLTRLSVGRRGKSPTTTELTNHLPSPPLLFSFRYRCRRRCCCRFRGSFFSFLPSSPFAFPPSLGGLRTLFYPRRRTLIGRGARSLPGPPTALHGPQRRSGQKRRKVRSPVALLPSSLPPFPLSPR